tara:strand:- start:207 stop:395 length:189 start_codon:yes stop_codon:yes gene_type:complete
MKQGYIEENKKGKFSVLIDIIDLGMLGKSPCFSHDFDTREEAKKWWIEFDQTRKDKGDTSKL